MTSEKQLLCCSCQLPLKPVRTELEYLGYGFSEEILRCPGCGQVYISPEMALNRMAEVELTLEDK